MEQKKIANILKVFCVGVAVVGALFFFGYAPALISELARMNTQADYLKIPMLVGVWTSGVLCYCALGFFWTICARIGKDNSFCMENAKAMRAIGMLAFVAAGLMVAAVIFAACVKLINLAVLAIAFFAICVAGGIGIVCLALSALIKRAAMLKEENDLTI